MRKQGWRGGARPLSEQWDGLAAGRLAAPAGEMAKSGPPPIADDFQPVYDLDALDEDDGFKAEGAAARASRAIRRWARTIRRDLNADVRNARGSRMMEGDG